MKQALLVFIALISLTVSIQLRHNFWYTAPKAAVVKGIPFSDVAWNYCDMKCTYLEKYNPGRDFVVIPFTESTFKPDFASCYVANNNNGTNSYVLWNTVTKNTYFETNCGGDTEDYWANSKGNDPKYKISGDILGQGIGTEITY